MKNQSVGFFLPGYETTGNTLILTTYLLAMNLDVQEKLQTEIDNFYEENPVHKKYIIAIIIYGS